METVNDIFEGRLKNTINKGISELILYRELKEKNISQRNSGPVKSALQKNGTLKDNYPIQILLDLSREDIIKFNKVGPNRATHIEHILYTYGMRLKNSDFNRDVCHDLVKYGARSSDLEIGDSKVMSKRNPETTKKVNKAIGFFTSDDPDLKDAGKELLDYYKETKRFGRRIDDPELM